MVNFSQLNSQIKQPLVIEPRQLFQTLQRGRKYEYLRDVQGDVLDEWYERRHEHDLVIKMSTGSGKTLVGLVLLWSRLKEGKGPVLYLCPNRHLAYQVRREADRLGITHTDFTQNNLFPTEFYDSTAILITTVQKLFNGRSVFKVAGRPDPVKVGTVLVDDAHTCINIARDQFTARFPKSSPIGKQLCSFFENSLKQQSMGTYADIDREKRDAYLRVPYWAWQERLPDVVELFSKRSDDEELRFVWPFLKVDPVLANSTVTISGERVEVAPRLVPIELVPSFSDAPSRVYMSATLVDDTALVRDFAAEPKCVQNPIKPKVIGDIGERLVISPQLIDSNIEEITTTSLVSDIRSSHQANVVILVPSSINANIWKTTDSMEVPGTDISDAIDRLSRTSGNTVIIANRYDGIDLPDAACRVLVIDDLPQEHRLANLVEATARRQSPILRRQIAQRIEQGIGRGVRSRTDYCVVILTGKKLVSFMTDVENQIFFTKETKRQIEIGKELSTMLKSGSTNAYQAILELVGQCLNRDPGWQTFHRDSLQDIKADRPIDLDAIALATAELCAWQYAFNGRYDLAADTIGGMISENNSLSDSDSGWYLQLQAEYLYHVDQTTALEKQLKAQELNRDLLKPPAGINYHKIQSKKTEQAYSILEWIRKSNESNALVVRSNMVFEDLSFGVSYDRFEEALKDLADIIGFQAQRPDKETGRGPDVLWRMTDGQYLIIEAKNQIDLERQNIFKKEADQLGHHVTWFEQEYPGELCTPILIHPSARLAYNAYLPTNAKVIRKGDLQQIVQSVTKFVAALASRPPGRWTVSDIATQLQTYQLRPTDFLNQRLGRKAVRIGQ